ncbi:dihydrofolate reductase, partial [Vibrio lentus]
IIGGGSIYESCLPKANKLYLTYIDFDVDGDTQFPDWGEGWDQSFNDTYQADEKNKHNMEFVILER